MIFTVLFLAFFHQLAENVLPALKTVPALLHGFVCEWSRKHGANDCQGETTCLLIWMAILSAGDRLWPEYSIVFYFQSKYEIWSAVAQGHEVLRQIFQYIPTKILLSSSSLVNKTWNYEARAFIRDRRKCTVKNNGEVSKFLQDLDQLCGQMKTAGRLCPFNSLKIVLPTICQSHCNPEEVSYGNINSQMKLKHINISTWGWGDAQCNCQCHMVIFKFLQQKAMEVETLKMDSAPLFYKSKNLCHAFIYTHWVRLEVRWTLDGSMWHNRNLRSAVVVPL